MEDLERICDECEKHSSSCKWPKTKARLACTQCTDKCIRCKIDGILVLNRMLTQVGSSERQHLTTLEVLEMASETAEVRKTPKMSGREQAWWVMAHMLEDLVGEQARLQESAEWQEELLEELVSNTKVIVDMMDLFMWGEHFLRVLEMVRPERPEETELVVRRHRMMEKGKGPEKNLEVVSEGVLEKEPEASCDVEMTLQ